MTATFFPNADDLRIARLLVRINAVTVHKARKQYDALKADRNSTVARKICCFESMRHAASCLDEAKSDLRALLAD